jgi:uncharacterized membrane protein YozB (DUF420 family)
MAAVTTDSAGRPAEVGRKFYLGLSVLMALVIVAGFSQTVPDDLTPPGLALPFIIHGLVFSSWVALVVVQPLLVSTGQVKRHRQLGLLGAGLAAAMVVMGVTATIAAYPYHRVPVFFPGGVFLVMNCLGIAVFGGLVAAAIRLRRQSDWHKRLMICATASILGPGLGRFLPMDSFGAAAPLVLFGVEDLILLAGPVADLIVRRRVHPAYLWGVAAVILSQVAIGPLAFSPPVLALVRTLRGH